LRRRQRRRVRTEEAFTKIGTQVVAKILNTLKKDCESRLFRNEMISALSGNGTIGHTHAEESTNEVSSTFMGKLSLQFFALLNRFRVLLRLGSSQSCSTPLGRAELS